MKYYLLTFNEDWADEHDVPALACFTEDQYNNWLQKSQWETDTEIEDGEEMPDDRYSKIYASLGNSGDGFSENFKECNTMQDFIDCGYVGVFEVNEEFYNTFNAAQISTLSLCNIFVL
jgi:hypothetical protein